MDTGKLEQWWAWLTPQTQALLLANPRDPIEGDALPEVVRSGQIVIGMFRPSVATGPNGYESPDEVQTWIEHRYTQE